MKLSIIVPVFNERTTITEILKQIRASDLAPAVPPGEVVDKEIIVVDDFSADGTREMLLEERKSADTLVVLHDRNMGKGAAVRSGLERATGDVMLIQDADLEYDPADYHLLLRPIVRGRSKVVYGSRFLGEHKAMLFWHAVGNRLVTFCTNLLYDTTLTDMETCYKVFTAEVARKIKLRSPRWGFDPEITASILKNGYRIYEVPISYSGREYGEGKKIRGKDVLVVLWTLLKQRFSR